MPPIDPTALLSVPLANLLAGFCASSYVGILYILQQTRITYSSQSAEGQAKERARRRDDPDVIRARLIAVSVSTIVSCAVVVGIIWRTSNGHEVCRAHRTKQRSCLTIMPFSHCSLLLVPR